ncbi:ribosomal-processing cysteine protease Prp [Mycoplasmatota bacterium zrk1]
MIEVRYIDGDIKTIELSGHSGYDERDKDIVCAAASSISITSFKAIEKFINKSDYKIIEKDGYLKVTINSNSKEILLLIENLLETLQELESQYPKYIKIYK